MPKIGLVSHTLPHHTHKILNHLAQLFFTKCAEYGWTDR
jgi:hypothetical protein